MSSLCNKTLKEIQAVQEDEGYRKAVESFTRHRLRVCQEEQDWEMIEKKLGCGQVEDLIEEAKDELTLIGKMIGKSKTPSLCDLIFNPTHLSCHLSNDKYFIHLYNEVAAKNSLLLVEISDSSESKSSLICVDNLRGVSEFSLDFLKDRVKVRASCNGLLCCSSIREKGVYYVCNPMTREFKLLPRSRERPVTRFYPDGEATLVGLACSLSMHKCHVVLAGYHRAFGHRPDGTFICLVFDSDSNKWRKFVSFQDDHFTHMNKNQVVFVNGALHWLTGSFSCILVLDLGLDIWRKISLPDEVGFGAGSRVYLLELDGCLSLIQISEVWMKIWSVTDYEGEQWHMIDRVSLRCIRGMVHGIFPISQNGEFVFLATHGQVLVHHRKSRVWKEMYSVKTNPALSLWFSAHAFRSTMFSCN